MKNKDIKKPVISSACPAVVRFIQIRFPNLIENLLKIESPMEIAAALPDKRCMRSSATI